MRKRLIAFDGRATSTYFASAIVDARSTFHLTYRLGIRLAQFVARGGAAAPGAGLWRSALPGFALLDIGLWLVLRRTQKFGLGWRLALDAADIGFWSLSPLPLTGSMGIAVQIGAPLTVEAGFRIGAWAFVVPATEVLVVAVVRGIAGRSLDLFAFFAVLIGVAMGMALFAYCQHLFRQSEIERALQLSAGTRRSFLAGQNSVAMGASSAVDAIEGLVPILGRPHQGSALHELADGWKTRLGASTAREATYLQVALLEWEREHNFHPDLSTRAELYVSEGFGTTLLTGAQVNSMRAALDGLRLRGEIEVAPGASDSHLRQPGTQLVLRVGDQEVVVPADTHTSLRYVDGSLVGYLMIATFIPLMAFPNTAALPWNIAILCIGMALAAGWYSHRQLTARGIAARRTNLRCAILTSLLLTCLLSLSIGHLFSADGDSNIVNVGLPLLALVGGACFRTDRRFRIEFIAGVLATFVLGLVMYRGPVDARGIVLIADWGFLLFFPAWQRIGSALAGAQQRHAAMADEADQNIRAEAFRRGQLDVLSLVQRARDDAHRQLVDVTPMLPPPLLVHAHARLEEVDRRLREIV